MPAFLYLADNILTISPDNRPSREYDIRKLSPAQKEKIASILNSERYSKSVTVENDLSVITYYFRQPVYVIPELFDTTRSTSTVTLHEFDEVKS